MASCLKLSRGFLAINILLNRLAHDPVGGALTLLGKLLHTFF